MEALFSSIPISEWGPNALLSMIVLLVMWGRLVPRQTLLDQKQETAYWREAHKNSEAARELLSGTLLEMTDSMETIEHLIRSLPRVEGPEHR